MKKLSIALVALAMAWPLQAARRTAAFEVSGWTCGSCAAATRIALKKLDGVEDVTTDTEKNVALVTYDDSKITTDRMFQAIAKLGYKAALKNGAATAGSPRSLSAIGGGLPRPGTILAVVWKSQNDRSDSAVEALFEKHKLAAAVLRGKAREQALKEYQPEQWYGAADVDRLSEHEARVIAARLVNRARSHFDLAPNRIAALTEDLALVFARHLTLRGEECDTRRDVIEQELTKAAGKYLNPQQLAELRKAGEQGIQALPGEDK